MGEYISDKGIDYIPEGKELDVALACYALQFPLMLRGPTGVGKTTLVSSLSRLLKKPLFDQLCTEDTISADLIGRNLPHGWVDGSATKSLRNKNGALYYLDELGEARSDAMTVVHSLTDDRRTLDAIGHDEILEAPAEWMLIASYNPGYQLRSTIKPSTAQRFITVDIPYPGDTLEADIISVYLQGKKYSADEVKKFSVHAPKKNKISDATIINLVKLANDLRRMAKSSDVSGLREGPGPRLTARTAKLIEYGLPELLAIEVGMINPLTYKEDLKKSMFDVTHKLFRE